jgi:hypothetical protein
MKYSNDFVDDNQDNDEPYRIGYDTRYEQTTLTLMDPYGSEMTLRMGKTTVRRLIRMLESTLDPDNETTDREIY